MGNKCKLERNMDLFKKEGKAISMQGQKYIVKHCLKCGAEFNTIPSKNFIFCVNCGKNPFQKAYKDVQRSDNEVC